MSQKLQWDDAYSGNLVPGDRPALLLVDMVTAYIEPVSPLYMSGSQAAAQAAGRLLEAARSASVPVIHTNVRYKSDGSDGGHFFRKVPALAIWSGDSKFGAFIEEVKPKNGEQIITKQYPSAFFDTVLFQHLQTLGIDTLVIAGYSTSGCIRASALDALQYGFIPILAVDACADRDSRTHESNIYDVGRKYAETQTVDEILRWFA